MKKLIVIFACLISMQAWADNDRPIAVTDLPVEAQTFLNTYFADSKVAFVKEETDFFEVTYDVLFADGSSVEFSNSGKWTDVRCRARAVPDAIVPAEITNYVNTTYAGAVILSIERGRYAYEIELSNGWEIKFDTRFNVIDIDR